ncbi:hypothetical protein [Saccharibacillus endophyticus]|uniref:Uncharacterized protein n=1 Tax=Saccharibacillus endophyticus TaxID=2060666 RepID=A0ABQ1ZLY4_9BACL|nr:hypothetical protein [Saccharibacillus endophyticus]GGH69264.1 hypothetical protein GCM10007362_04150 [Saccharibacillus endophyticus]
MNKTLRVLAAAGLLATMIGCGSDDDNDMNDMDDAEHQQMDDQDDND